MATAGTSGRCLILAMVAARRTGARHCAVWLVRWLLVGALAGCGGGGGSSDSSNGVLQAQPTAVQASRFLAQASFGATATEIERVQRLGYAGWLDDQFTRLPRLHRTYLDARSEVLRPLGLGVVENDFLESFWNSAIIGEDQLRQRMTFALSQIFVVSFADAKLFEQARGIASYYDMLSQGAFGNLRTLLKDVAKHPMMGVYLSSLRNQKEGPGRVPDENFARELMQLFSIGLYQLNADGSAQRDSNGLLIDTYGSADIGGLAKVFTGWSWYAGLSESDRTEARFFGDDPHPDRDWRPMQAYTTTDASFHSTSEKRFLGRVIAPSNDAEADLEIALDTIFQHPNVGPFIGRQLIQRLVTSNPSPAYIGRVSAVFADNGSGVRGDLRAVLRAILLDPEARDMPVTDLRAGKLREPVLRLAQFLRAFNSVSDSGRWFGIDNTDDPATSLGQTPMRAPTVFNFFRPDYAPNHPELAAAAVVAPELQIVSEVSVAGYLNYMQDWLEPGVARDVRQNYMAERTLARTPVPLIDHLDVLLAGGRLSPSTRARVQAAIEAVPIPSPALDANGQTTNAAAIDAALQQRVSIAVWLVMASPDFLVQR